VGAISPLTIRAHTARWLRRDRGLTLQAGAAALKPTHCSGVFGVVARFCGDAPKQTVNSGARASADGNSAGAASVTP
jgi:hypothetical protein